MDDLEFATGSNAIGILRWTDYRAGFRHMETNFRTMTRPTPKKKKILSTTCTSRIVQKTLKCKGIFLDCLYPYVVQHLYMFIGLIDNNFELTLNILSHHMLQLMHTSIRLLGIYFLKHIYTFSVSLFGNIRTELVSPEMPNFISKF